MTRCVTRGSVVSSGLKFWSTTRLNGPPCLTHSCRRPMRQPAGGTRDIAASSPGLYPVRRFLKIMAPSTSGPIVSSRRRSNLPTLTLDRLLTGEVQEQHSDSSMRKDNVLLCGQGKSVLPMYAEIEREALNGEGRRGTLGDPPHRGMRWARPLVRLTPSDEGGDAGQRASE